MQGNVGSLKLPEILEPLTGLINTKDEEAAAHDVTTFDHAGSEPTHVDIIDTVVSKDNASGDIIGSSGEDEDKTQQTSNVTDADVRAPAENTESVPSTLDSEDISQQTDTDTTSQQANDDAIVKPADDDVTLQNIDNEIDPQHSDSDVTPHKAEEDVIPEQTNADATTAAARNDDNSVMSTDEIPTNADSS